MTFGRDDAPSSTLSLVPAPGPSPEPGDDVKRLQEELLHAALHDGLTGLANRRLFLDRLHAALTQRAQGEGRSFAVLFLDVDRFKSINETIGFQAGDRLLVEVARRLEACLRSRDTVARFGGDEFTILLEDLEIDGHRVVAHACIGIALSKPGHTRPEDVVRDADRALQKAKALGKPGFQVFDSAMDGRAMSLAQLEAALRHALDREEFRTHYQPIVSVKGGKVAGFEVLLWRRSPNGPGREPGRNGGVSRG